jgi:UDP-N-acetylmuramoylalanine--D-glutamate ligase
MAYGVLNKLNVDLSHEQITRNFEGLEHRIEFVREIDGVKYINDSKSSSPDATRAAIESLTNTKNIILILGGNDKSMKFDLLNHNIRENVKQIILLPGNIEEKIKSEFSDLEIKELSDLDSSVRYAKDIAEKGDIVLLSPAATSFKLYENYEERGRHFKEIVNDF